MKLHERNPKREWVHVALNRWWLDLVNPSMGALTWQADQFYTEGKCWQLPAAVSA